MPHDQAPGCLPTTAWACTDCWLALTQVISGVLGVEVDGHRYFDGGLAELVPDITPEQVGSAFKRPARIVDPPAGHVFST